MNFNISFILLNLEDLSLKVYSIVFLWISMLISENLYSKISMRHPYSSPSLSKSDEKDDFGAWLQFMSHAFFNFLQVCVHLDGEIILNGWEMMRPLGPNSAKESKIVFVAPIWMIVTRRRPKAISRWLPSKFPSTTLRRREMIRRWTEGSVAYRLRLEKMTEMHEVNAFEAEDSIFPFGHTELRVGFFNKRSRPLVTFYAKMGLHRYNLIEGTKYKFSAVEKYNRTVLCGPNHFYITLAAIDPANGSTQSIQVRVNEHALGRFDLSCDIAVPLGDPKVYPDPDIGSFLFDLDRSFPKWPLEDPFNSPQRFYLVNKSELQDNEWIRLYLELTVAKNRMMYNKDGDLSKLEILQVAIEETSATTSQYPNKGCLNAKNITVYMSYRDTSEARVGKYIDRIAMVSRSYDVQWNCFCLMGHNLSAETLLNSHDEKCECFSLVGSWESTPHKVGHYQSVTHYRSSVTRLKRCDEKSGCFSLAAHNQSSETKLKSSDEQSGCFSLVGQNQSSETLTEKSRKSVLRQRLGVHKPKWRKAYKNRLHKTRSMLNNLSIN